MFALLPLMFACPKMQVGEGVPTNGVASMRPVYVPDPAVEARVAEAVAGISALYNAGKFSEAKLAIEKTLADEGENSWSATLQGWRDELATLGKPAPELAVTAWIQGEPPPAEGTTLVVFFEAWCPHCQQEMPVLAKEADELATAGLHVVGVTQQSRGLSDDELQSFLASAGVHFAIAREDGTMSEAYGVAGIPSLAVIQNGTVVFRGHPSLLSPDALTAFLAPPVR